MPAAEPERSRRRRLGALALLVIGIALGATVLSRGAPRDQALIVRLPEPTEAVPIRLDVSVTPVGDREPIAGFSQMLSSPPPREVPRQLRLPNGDYIIALELTSAASTGPSAPKKSETSRARRVTLTGDETVVVFDAEGSD